MEDGENMDVALMNLVNHAIASEYQLADIRGIRLRDDSSHAGEFAQLLDSRQDAFDKVRGVGLGVLGDVASNPRRSSRLGSVQRIFISS